MTNKKYVAAIDQGTTSTRCIIFDHNGEQAAVGQKSGAIPVAPSVRLLPMATSPWKTLTR